MVQSREFDVCLSMASRARRPCRLWAAFVLVFGTAGALCRAHAAPVDPAEQLRATIAAACNGQRSGLVQMASVLPGATAAGEEAVRARSTVIGWRQRFTWPDGHAIKLERLAPGGQLRRLSAEYWTLAGQRPRPLMIAIAGPSCQIGMGRRLLCANTQPNPVAVEELDAALAPTGVQEPLDPSVAAGKDPGGVPVAMVDAGVNYLLPEILHRLARDPQGEILGYDYWDLDPGPFDANPAQSPFFPQHHGTRTASLLLREAPQVRLVPYRYPRPDMSRVAELIDNAARRGVVVVNLSLGSDKAADWQAFAAAARKHPQMLFVVAAGNQGRDIDAQPTYPAALRLPNLISVSSAEVSGEPARGSNWGRLTVDLLVLAEEIITTDFTGAERRVGGSSYASVRVSALAARLLAVHPNWRTPQLKTAIFARALPPTQPVVAQGFIPDPARAEQHGVAASSSKLEKREQAAFTHDDLYPRGTGALRFTYTFKPTLAYLTDTRWNRERLRPALARAAGILAQCGVFIPAVDVYALQGPDSYRYFLRSTAEELVHRLSLPKPTLYFVRDTLQQDAYEAEAIGKANSADRPDLMYTIWVMEDIKDLGVALAHEIVHVLMDSGEHVDFPRNLMRAETSAVNIELVPDQCARMTRIGARNGLLKPIE